MQAGHFRPVFISMLLDYHVVPFFTITKITKHFTVSNCSFTSLLNDAQMIGFRSSRRPAYTDGHYAGTNQDRRCFISINESVN